MADQFDAVTRLPEDLAKRVVAFTGMVLTLAGLGETLGYFNGFFSFYDEGALLTNAFLIGQGAIPYRDYYTSYPPGISVLILLSWGILGISATAARILGFALHMVAAVGAGRLVGRATGGSFSWLTCGLVTLWITPLGVVPSAWLAALTVAVWTLEVTANWWTHRSSGKGLAAGAMLGLVSAFRQDLFVYLALALLALALAWALRNDRRLPAGWTTYTIGVVTSVLLIWLPLFALSGFEQVARDLYFDQAQVVAPARTLPFEHPLDIRANHWIATIGMGLAGPLLAGLLGAAKRPSLPRTLVGTLLAALALAVLPQMLNRSDWDHLVGTVLPGLCAVALMLEVSVRSPLRAIRTLSLIALGLFLLIATRLLPPLDFLRNLPRLDLSARSSGIPPDDYDPMQPALEFILSHTAPGDAIFVGNDQHRLVTYNNLSLYYLTARPGATRHMQFDPGLTTSEAVQQEMIRDLDSVKPRVAVLLRAGYVLEPNRSRLPGSRTLDEYLESRYRIVDSSPAYLMLVRR